MNLTPIPRSKDAADDGAMIKENEKMKRIEEINSRKAEIRSMLEGTEEINMDALEKELRELNVEMAQIERRTAIASSIQ